MIVNGTAGGTPSKGTVRLLRMSGVGYGNTVVKCREES